MQQRNISSVSKSKQQEQEYLNRELGTQYLLRSPSQLDATVLVKDKFRFQALPQWTFEQGFSVGLAKSCKTLENRLIWINGSACNVFETSHPHVKIGWEVVIPFKCHKRVRERRMQWTPGVLSHSPGLFRKLGKVLTEWSLNMRNKTM